MKTINKRKTKVSSNIKVFTDKQTGKNCGFAGEIEVYDSKIYIDTRNGTGYDKALKKLEPLVYKFASQFNFNGNTFDDTRHDIIVHILEGIPRYNPNKNTKLSTFIEMRVNRRLINDLRDQSRMSKNATFLNYGLYNIKCKCGTNFIEKLDNFTQCKCVGCDEHVDNAKKIPIGVPEISIGGSYDDYSKSPEFLDDEAIFMCDMGQWLNDEDKRVVKIIELIYFGDYSIKAAAEKVGLSGAGANMKLKNLAKNKVVKEIFNR